MSTRTEMLQTGWTYTVSNGTRRYSKNGVDIEFAGATSTPWTVVWADGSYFMAHTLREAANEAEAAFANEAPSPNAFDVYETDDDVSYHFTSPDVVEEAIYDTARYAATQPQL